MAMRGSGMKIAIVGQGYVGLPLSIAAADAGHHVIGIDSNELLVNKLQGGFSPIRDVEDTTIQAVLKSQNYLITNDFDVIEEMEIVIICVPTPLDINRQPDHSFLIAALESISKRLQPGTLIINESTVSPGTTRGLIKETLDKAGVPYELAYSPERIDPANKKWTVTNTPKLVAGLTPTATERAVAFYKTFVDSVTVGSSPEVIETAKLLENSFRLVNISFVNEIAQFCAALGVDVREVVDAAATKPYGFMPFYPGAGVGGHCIPVDPSYLVAKAQELKVHTRFIDLANNVNQSLATYFTGVATGILGELKGKKIVVVGVAYKPEVADIRETPAEGLIKELRARGADVKWHDDLIQEWNGEKSVPLSADFDLAILVNPHSNTDLDALGSTRVLNTRGGY
jgi:UDP-N-acetyl-D-glucosamine dehydrogenase